MPRCAKFTNDVHVLFKLYVTFDAYPLGLHVEDDVAHAVGAKANVRAEIAKTSITAGAPWASFVPVFSLRDSEVNMAVASKNLPGYVTHVGRSSSPPVLWRSAQNVSGVGCVVL